MDLKYESSVDDDDIVEERQEERSPLRPEDSLTFNSSALEGSVSLQSAEDRAENDESASNEPDIQSVIPAQIITIPTRSTDLPAIESIMASKVKAILLEQGLITDREFKKAPNPDIRDSDLTEKIIKWTELRAKGLTFNDRLLSTHAFRNPSIMNKAL